MKPDLKAISERAGKAQKELFALCRGKRFIMSIPPMKDDTDMLIGDSLQDVSTLITYAKDLEAVVEAAREAKHHDYITPELDDALAKLDGDNNE